MSLVKLDSKAVNIARTFELLAGVSGPLEGGIADWPSHIQDKIWERLEALSKRLKLPLAIVAAHCDYDIDTGWYIDVWASEIVAKTSERYSKDAIPVVEFNRMLGTIH